uniref:Uncharacterized protein n=1 Tax=Oryza glumipatula TaxID=40148 RepID=A0A0E0BC79_9ORYZ
MIGRAATLPSQESRAGLAGGGNGGITHQLQTRQRGEMVCHRRDGRRSYIRGGHARRTARPASMPSRQIGQSCFSSSPSPTTAAQIPPSILSSSSGQQTQRKETHRRRNPKKQPQLVRERRD